ncbi:MAG: type II toxin-antitoxin system VapC family toxin [Dehalococcoidia bacterium]|nr:type II toxin-antitoxin system VapC family toxin [Dehalococcoidia bacterium]
MAGKVCVDASLALMLLLPHELTEQTETLWRHWLEDGTELVSPALFFAEVTSVLRESVYFGRILPDEGESAFNAFLKLGVRSVEPAGLQSRAWELAKKYNRPRAYDSQYLAVASSLGCELWTGDRRLVNSIREPWLKWVGEYKP